MSIDRYCPFYIGELGKPGYGHGSIACGRDAEYLVDDQYYCDMHGKVVEDALEQNPVTTGHFRLRPGDQPLPTPNEFPRIHDLVIADVKSRMDLGTARYGVPLQPNNGRDALRDAYEEVLDAAAYLRQAMYERDGK